jgi:F-box-like
MESVAKRRRIQADVRVEWSALPQEIFLDIASHWDVATLAEKKRVCRDWKQLCTDAIDSKRTTQKAFSTSDEIQATVKKYCGYHEKSRWYSQLCSREDAEEIATTYGWPMNKWDVSNIQDFSSLFRENWGFNQDFFRRGMYRMPHQ